MAKYIDQMLPCKLTETEIQEKIRKLVSFKQDFRRILGDEARFKMEIKMRKENVEPTINSLEKEIAEETEQRRVKCQLVFDSEAMTVSTMRTDTYEQVGKSRAMTQEEIDQYVKVDLVKLAERKDQEAAAAAEGNDPQTREEEAATGSQEGDLAAEGDAPADLAEGAEEADQALPAGPDKDGWLETAQGAQEAAEGDGLTLADDAPDGGKEAPQEAPPAPAVDAMEDWGNVEFPEVPPAVEPAPTREGAAG